MPIAGHIHKRCGCRNPQTGRQLGAHCPKLTTRGHGSWYLTLDIPPGLDGVRRRLRKGGFTSRRAAAKALAQLQASGSDPHASLLTIAQWLRIWIASRVSLQPATLRNYTAHIDSYLIPHLGGIPLRDLSIRDVQHMFTTIMRRGTITRRPASATLLARLHATLRAALNAAVRENLLLDNPSRHIELPRLHRPHAVVWTSDQIAEWQRSGTRPRVAIWTAAQTATFLTAISGHRLYAVYHLIALRGLRRGEAAGLRWCDLDLDAALITINSQTQRLNGGGLAQCPPKTPTSRRTIALDRTTVTALRRHRDLQQAELALLGEDGGGYVFTTQRGRPMTPDVLTRTFGTMIHESRLPPIRLHDLRHGAASLALQAGADLKVIQDQLGHSSIVLTADTYVTVVPQVARDTAEAVARLICEAGRRPPGSNRPRRRGGSVRKQSQAGGRRKRRTAVR